MKYTVSWIKESAKGNTNGRDWIKYEVTLKDEQGIETTAKTFDACENGSIIEGEITHDPKWGSSFKKITPKAVAGANFKAKQIEETMHRKETSIKGFQDNKEFSIMVASSMSGAINLAIAEYGDGRGMDSLQTLVEKWRAYIINNWSVDKTDIDPF